MTRQPRKTPAERPARAPRKSAAQGSPPEGSPAQEPAAQESAPLESAPQEALPQAPVAQEPPAQPPSTPAASPASQLWLGWAAAILVVVVVLIGIALGVERFDNGAQRSGPEVQLTPIVGGMAVPATLAGSSGEPSVTATTSGAVTATGTLSATEAVSPAAAETTSETMGATAGAAEPQVTIIAGPAPVFAPDMTVQNSAGSVIIYAEPDAGAQVLDSYAAGVTLTVLEPGGDFAAYPVELNGAGWVRVRAADGLVGWTPAAGLTVVE